MKYLGYYLVLVGFAIMFTIALNAKPAHGTEMLTPACAPLEDVVNENTIKQGVDAGGTYVKLTGDEAVKVSNRLQEINNEDHMKVDRLDFLFFSGDKANLVTSYSGCIQEATHLRLNIQQLEVFKAEGTL